MDAHSAELVRRFRKRPVVIEAVQLTAENVGLVAGWCHARSAAEDHLLIGTLEVWDLAGDLAAIDAALRIDGSEGT